MSCRQWNRKDALNHLLVGLWNMHDSIKYELLFRQLINSNYCRALQSGVSPSQRDALSWIQLWRQTVPLAVEQCVAVTTQELTIPCNQFGVSQVTTGARGICVHKVPLLLIEDIVWMVFLSCSRLILGSCSSFILASLLTLREFFALHGEAWVTSATTSLTSV